MKHENMELYELSKKLGVLLDYINLYKEQKNRGIKAGIDDIVQLAVQLCIYWDVEKNKELQNELESVYQQTLQSPLVKFKINELKGQLSNYLIHFRKIEELVTYGTSITNPFFYIDGGCREMYRMLSIAMGEYSEEDEDNTCMDKELLPIRINTDRAKKYFPKAIELGIIAKTPNGYKMGTAIKTKVLLAYFLELVFCCDDKGRYNGAAFPETELNLLFAENRLSKARYQYSANTNGDGKPRGYEIVDRVFE